jgi:methylated-DNA-[protein]-cysteine S-methyltransferase
MPEGLESAPPVAEPLAPPLKVLLPSPIGDLGLTLRGTVVTGLKVAPQRSEKSRYTPFAKLADSDFLDEVFGRLSEYLAGARPSPDLDYDLAETGLGSFARRVLKETAKVPYGKTRTYRKIATGAGRPEAYRQVLAILMANPIPLLIPCHRVVTNKSGIGSWVAGKERKRWLLAMERDAARNGGDEEEEA